MNSSEANKTVDANAPIPGSVFTPKQVRLLRIVVVVLGVLLLVGFALVIGTIAYRASKPGAKAPEAAGQGGDPSLVLPGAGGLTGKSFTLPVPKGAEVVATIPQGNRLILQLESPEGAQIVVVDMASGKVLSRVTLQPAP